MFHELSEREHKQRVARWWGRQGRPPTRGVYRDRVAPPGEQWYKIVTSDGKVGMVHLPIELCDPSLEENLWKRLDALDKESRLRAV